MEITKRDQANLTGIWLGMWARKFGRKHPSANNKSFFWRQAAAAKVLLLHCGGSQETAAKLVAYYLREYAHKESSERQLVLWSAVRHTAAFDRSRARDSEDPPKLGPTIESEFEEHVKPEWMKPNKQISRTKMMVLEDEE